MNNESISPYWAEQTFIGKLYLQVQNEKIAINVGNEPYIAGENESSLRGPTPPPTPIPLLKPGTQDAVKLVFKFSNKASNRLSYQLLDAAGPARCTLDERGHIILRGAPATTFELEVLSAEAHSLRCILYSNNQRIRLFRYAFTGPGPRQVKVLRLHVGEACEFVIERC
ncbi:hypothetical protein [Pseudomonas sp. CC120222-01a]|uniref:hypothetical protein n=1 Tax=Pseudomonas sp. CC120222-01a TaxID=1378075 RepID=UPI000D981831|nr:hypothetical protein [Pseudomonas sp. CC120222-01a]PVZ42732.1 hypothetical protein N430_01345 [Pseudomonas sp. CC120222-01a]